MLLGGRSMKTPLDRKARTRARIAFLFLFVFVIALSVGAYVLTNLGTVQESIAAHQRQAASQGLADPKQIDEALRRHPPNKLLQMIAMATKAAHETDAAIESLSNEVEPAALSKNINLAKASRGDLEALRSDLKLAEANATALTPRSASFIWTRS